jgi:hypothetical protein
LTVNDYQQQSAGAAQVKEEDGKLIGESLAGLLQGPSELPLPQAVDQQTQGHAQGSGQCRQELQQTTSPLNTSRAMAAFERMEEKVKNPGLWTCCQGKCHLPYPE